MQQDITQPANLECREANSQKLSDSEAWDELLSSEASQRFLEAEVKKAQELLGEQTA